MHDVVVGVVITMAGADAVTITASWRGRGGVFRWSTGRRRGQGVKAGHGGAEAGVRRRGMSVVEGVQHSNPLVEAGPGSL